MKTHSFIFLMSMFFYGEYAISEEAPKDGYGTAEFRICVVNTNSSIPYSGYVDGVGYIDDSEVVQSFKHTFSPPIDYNKSSCSQIITQEIYNNGYIIGDFIPSDVDLGTGFKILFNGWSADNDWSVIDGADVFLSIGNDTLASSENKELTDVEDEETINIVFKKDLGVSP